MEGLLAFQIQIPGGSLFCYLPLYPLCSPSKDEWISLLLHQHPMSAFIIFILLGKPRQSKLLIWSKGLCNPTSDNSQSQVRAETIPSHCISCLFNIHDPWVLTRAVWKKKSAYGALLTLGPKVVYTLMLKMDHFSSQCMKIRFIKQL